MTQLRILEGEDFDRHLIILLRERNARLVAALEKIRDKHLYADQYQTIAREALANQQSTEKP
jgi:hypothetical protein